MQKYNMKEKIDGYMTVEASFIIPRIFLLFCMVLYLTFFLYNHCVGYKACYIAALRGQQIRFGGNNDLEIYVSGELKKLLEEQVYQYQDTGSVNINALSIEVTASGKIENKLKNMDIYKDSSFGFEHSVKLMKFNPASVIRKTRG